MRFFEGFWFRNSCYFFYLLHQIPPLNVIRSLIFASILLIIASYSAHVIANVFLRVTFCDDDGLLFSIICNSLFFKQEMELSLIGLQNAGKTSLVNVVAVRIYPLDIIIYCLYFLCKIIDRLPNIFFCVLHM